jgi:hypothetical protein
LVIFGFVMAIGCEQQKKAPPAKPSPGPAATDDKMGGEPKSGGAPGETKKDGAGEPKKDGAGDAKKDGGAAEPKKDGAGDTKKDGAGDKKPAAGGDAKKGS